MATKSKAKAKAPKVGNYRGGSKTSVTGRGGFNGKTTSGGNLGRAAMTNSAAQGAAAQFGRGAADAASFGLGGGMSGGGNFGGSPGIIGDNTSGAGVDTSASGLIESLLNPGGQPINVPGGYQGQGQGIPGGAYDGQDFPGVSYQAPPQDTGEDVHVRIPFPYLTANATCMPTM